MDGIARAKAENAALIAQGLDAATYKGRPATIDAAVIANLKAEGLGATAPNAPKIADAASTWSTCAGFGRGKNRGRRFPFLVVKYKQPPYGKKKGWYDPNNNIIPNRKRTFFSYQ